MPTSNAGITPHYVTYIEWEKAYPNDTTWWTFTDGGELLSCWKQNSWSKAYIQFNKGMFVVNDSELTCSIRSSRPTIPAGGTIHCDISNGIEKFYEDAWIIKLKVIVWEKDTLFATPISGLQSNMVRSAWHGPSLKDCSHPIFHEYDSLNYGSQPAVKGFLK